VGVNDRQECPAHPKGTNSALPKEGSLTLVIGGERKGPTGVVQAKTSECGVRGGRFPREEHIEPYEDDYASMSSWNYGFGKIIEAANPFAASDIYSLDRVLERAGITVRDR